MTPKPLSRATLRAFDPLVSVPAYDPAGVTPGIVHLGFGGFHRAHMARYTHDLMNRNVDAREWGIIGAGLLPADRRMRDALTPQDNLYTLVERSGDDEAAVVVGAVTELIYAGDGPAALLDAIDRPGIRIVSLTVTENGYRLNRATKRLDTADPQVATDLTNPRQPRSAVGILVEAYRRRRAAGRAAFTALSCDNIQDNGRVLRRAVLDYAAATDGGLAKWIEVAASFPNTMVDRITPATTEDDIAGLARRHGVVDRWPVFSETFRQWVIEDDFVAGRPAWEDVGAHFVADVAPYEFMKLRLLNASHLAVAGLGRLIGYDYIHETMSDPRLRAYMVALMERETGPTVPPLPGVDLPSYQATLVERFANPSIMDTVERVNTDAPLNVLLDPLRDRVAGGQCVDLLALALAAWLRRVRGTNERGDTIAIRHPLAEELRRRAEQGGADPRPLLTLRPLFGDIVDQPMLVGTISEWLGSLHEVGAAETLRRGQMRGAF